MDNATLKPPTPAHAHTAAGSLLLQHQPGWNAPHLRKLAAPTYAPAMTAFGIVFIALGAVTMWIVSVIGVLIFALAMTKWIGELLHD